MYQNILKRNGRNLIRNFIIEDALDRKVIYPRDWESKYKLYIPRDGSVIYKTCKYSVTEVDNGKHKHYPSILFFNRSLRIYRHILKWLVFNSDKIEEIGGDYVIHHKNYDRYDYSLDNLECIKDSLHKAIHRIDRLKGKDRYVNALNEVRVIDKWFNTSCGCSDDFGYLENGIVSVLIKYGIIRRDDEYTFKELLRLWTELGGMVNRELLEGYID